MGSTFSFGTKAELKLLPSTLCCPPDLVREYISQKDAKYDFAFSSFFPLKLGFKPIVYAYKINGLTLYVWVDQKW